MAECEARFSCCAHPEALGEESGSLSRAEPQERRPRPRLMESHSQSGECKGANVGCVEKLGTTVVAGTLSK